MNDTGVYDVDAPEGAKGMGSQYMTRKDAKWILGVTLVVAIGLIPVYLTMREKAYKSTCVKNMGEIMEAMEVYSSQHDDRLPPAFEADERGEPQIRNGYPLTWITEIQPMFSTRASFTCQTADPSEYSYSANSSGGPPIAASYGFYQAYSGYGVKEIDNPDGVVLLAETSNSGAATSYDPLPFTTTKYDGFVIGWNNSNQSADEQTSAVTRLAFPNTTSGDFGIGNARHSKVIHAVTASRRKINLTSPDAQTIYEPAKYGLGGYWREPIRTNGR